MKFHEFEIGISPDGEVKVHIKGIKGKACMQYAEMFERILGEIADVEHTSDYYEKPDQVKVQPRLKIKT